MVEHYYVKFGVLAATVFEISCGKKDRQTDTQTNADENLYLHDCRRRE